MKHMSLLFFLFITINCSNRKLIESIYKFEASGIVKDCEQEIVESATVKSLDFEIETSTNDQGEWTLSKNDVSKCENNVCEFSITYTSDSEEPYTVIRRNSGFKLKGTIYNNENIIFYVNKVSKNLCKDGDDIVDVPGGPDL